MNKIETSKVPVVSNYGFLSPAIDLVRGVLSELHADADEGEYIYRENTANPTNYDLYDLLGIISHPVKGFVIKNDGASTIRFGHNITPLSVDSSILVSSARFGSLLAGERIRFAYNRKKINNIYIISAAGNPAYRLWMIW